MDMSKYIGEATAWWGAPEVFGQEVRRSLHRGDGIEGRRRAQVCNRRNLQRRRGRERNPVQSGQQDCRGAARGQDHRDQEETGGGENHRSIGRASYYGGIGNVFRSAAPTPRLRHLPLPRPRPRHIRRAVSGGVAIFVAFFVHFL